MTRKDCMSSAFRHAKDRYMPHCFRNHTISMLHMTSADTTCSCRGQSWAMRSGTDGCLENLNQLSVLVRLWARAEQR